MSDKPNFPGLVEDPQHPDFKNPVADLDGVVWMAMIENDPAKTPQDPVLPSELIWERLAISPERMRQIDACTTSDELAALGPQ